jgi:hypothetical protein
VTYRSSRGGRAARRREHKAAEMDDRVQARVRDWLLHHPPRVELPLEHGTWRDHDRDGYDNVYEVEFSEAPRPRYPIHRVPMAPDPPMLVHMGSAAMTLRTFDMRAVEWGAQFGRTRIRWWNWEPIGLPAEAETYRVASKSIAFMSRCKTLVEWLAQADPRGHRTGVPGDLACEWWRETIDALESWRGRVASRYAVPSEADPAKPEWRTSP